ncbi:MAG: hypothetical protein F6K55_35225 [Moorea sp. SIO4A3]|nr:hypothetical protein [Moorena sp. SIO4A3]
MAIYSPLGRTCRMGIRRGTGILPVSMSCQFQCLASFNVLPVSMSCQFQCLASFNVLMQSASGGNPRRSAVHRYIFARASCPFCGQDAHSTYIQREDSATPERV